jgi:hypothetical protein
VGERVVKGWWKSPVHARGVPGTYGKGYEGVRRGTAPIAGVVGTLPRMVLADSVELVEVDVMAEVDDMVDKGLATSGSSLSGDGRLLSWLVRIRCCSNIFALTASLNLARVSSSGMGLEDMPLAVPSPDVVVSARVRLGSLAS